MMMNTFAFTTFDFVILGIVGFSGVLGLMRGFIKELISLVGFVASIWIGYNFSKQISEKWLTAFPGGETGQLIIAFILLFISSLIIAKLIANSLVKVLSSAGLSFIDRFLGTLFGLFRGALIVVAMSTLVALTDIPKSNEWKDALTRPLVETTVGFMKNLLPDNWVQKLSDSTDIRQLNK